jgi:transcriptional regulator with PAS, ATPase and Fis domain
MPDFVPLKVYSANYVRQVLAEMAGNKSAAARALGISRRAMYRWLQVGVGV